MTWKYTGKTSAFKHLKFDGRTNCALDYGLDPSLFKRGAVCLYQQAVVMLASLNRYDQQQVMKEIYHITKNPKSASSVKHSRNPFTFLYRSRYPFRNYHYLIKYKQSTDGEVVIEDILYDYLLHGRNQSQRKGFIKPAWQRPMLYHVRNTKYRPYDSAKSEGEIDEFATHWVVDDDASHQVSTAHAAVNGMLNDFGKAAWLMGVHSQAAYPADKVQEYTLVHNPTDGVLLDLVECAFDKRLGRKSHNAQQLAAVLRQCQQQGKAVKWTVHSQGTIIFCAALEELIKRGCHSLNKQQVAIHGSGAKLERVKRTASKLGMHINNVRNNPFDLVPNLAGRVDTSASGLKRSMQFLGLTFGESAGASPHSLPYLGIETYRTQLQILGNTKHLSIVDNYIIKHTGTS
ncbi:hypothetical protein F9L16_01695 [Agarivorans sp. B2Z047]|uniref:hypothetical protein n=1 Tax=Agarivorans sp. B2Z047 TaxID=2652721 RepID=UPI00128CF786|nr:hypothetical protein [Agarivorans sp. B2Z047]MPW27714.1 hypothetical protein [Agarivorans sp. B2Z047]UQN44447.1 hypothetical protein LQZ07_08265 [Agarivorans sp. B2Z047]